MRDMLSTNDRPSVRCQTPSPEKSHSMIHKHKSTILARDESIAVDEDFEDYCKNTEHR